MTGTKIKDFTKTAPPTRAGSEHLTAGEPADKHKLVRRGDLESFAVGLLLIKLDVFGKITRNRVRRFDYPDTFLFVIFTPFLTTTGSHQFHKRLTQMGRMKYDKSHAVKHPLANPLRNLVRNLCVGNV